MQAIPAIEAAKFYPEVPKLFWQNQDLERDGYEGVIYRVHPQATSADEAEDAGHADIVFPAIEQIGQQLRPDRRQGAVEKGR